MLGMNQTFEYTYICMYMYMNQTFESDIKNDSAIGLRHLEPGVGNESDVWIYKYVWIRRLNQTSGMNQTSEWDIWNRRREWIRRLNLFIYMNQTFESDIKNVSAIGLRHLEPDVGNESDVWIYKYVWIRRLNQTSGISNWFVRRLFSIKEDRRTNQILAWCGAEVVWGSMHNALHTVCTLKRWNGLRFFVI